MKHNYLLFSYQYLLKKYKKYVSRLQNHLNKGTFRTMVPRKRNFLLQKVEELKARLLQLQPRLVGTVAATALITALSMTTAQAQNPTFEYNDAKNPFSSHSVPPLELQSIYNYSSPAIGDLDGDGDFDIVISNNSSLRYYENTGTTAAPLYVQKSNEENPFSSDNGVSVEYNYPGLSLADIDGDGDLDLLAGGGFDGTGQIITYYKNTGTASSPVFEQQTGTDNPFPALANFTYYGTPAVVDIDGDGDLDVFVSDSEYGRMFFLENTGDATNPVYVENTVDNPFPEEDLSTDGSGGYLFPAFVDIDADGDMDVVMGQDKESMLYFKNTGSATNPVMEVQSGVNNPFSDFAFYWQVPSFKDLDNDGDQDMVVGMSNETNIYYNNGTATDPLFALPKNYGPRPTIRFADMTGDGNPDAVFSLYQESNSARYFVNNGPASAPTFTESTGEDNPFAEVISPYGNAFADLDGDADIDFLAAFDGGIYYENSGTSTTPGFLNNPVGNPFYEINVQGTSYDFVDLDGDGDQDLPTNGIGEEVEPGNAFYYKNTGTSTAPVFEMQSGSDNPLAAIPYDVSNELTFVNFDGDDDFDLVIGTENNGILYYQNTGSASNPVFEQQTGSDNPFTFINEAENGVEGKGYSTDFMDVDADGDLDLFVAESNGTVTLYENTSAVVTGLFGSSASQAALTAYPNPVKDVLHYALSDAKSNSTVQVSVMDMTGVEVMNQSQQYTDAANINVSSLKTGIYMLRMSSEAKVAVVKFVKQ